MIFPDARAVFAESLASIVCERAEDCCEPRGRSTPGEACLSDMRNDAYIIMLLADEEQITLALDAGTPCLDRYRKETGCDGTLLPESLPALCPDLFGDIPAGPAPAGAACEHTYDCAAPSGGDRACIATSSTASACIWFVPAEAGEACAMDPVVVGVCPEGMGCRPLAEGDPPRCEPLGGYGAACFAGDSCLEGLTCSRDLDGSYSCADTIPKDELCDERPDACEPSLYCEPGSNRCRVLPVVAACADPACPDYALQKVCR